jgi:integrase
MRFKLVRESWVASGKARSQCNKMAGRLRRAFKWGVEQELVAPSIYEALRAVEPLKKGRTAAKDRPKVKPVPDAVVDATLPLLSPVIRRMVELQRLTGMRPGEVCALQVEYLDRSGAVWVATLSKHKNEIYDHARTAYFGPKAQAIVDAHGLPASGFVFVAAARGRNKRHSHYRERSYRNAIARAIKRYNDERKDGEAPLPHWHPHQIRHTVGTVIRRRFGVELAKIVLGHSTLTATEIYAERDVARAMEVVAEIG